MNILRLPGSNALSDFRREALLQRCRQAEPAVRGLEARHFYLVHWQGGDRNRLEALVFGDPAGPDGSPTEGSGLSAATTICIAPRPGTISPWSTKATDILRNCGLTSVARIERGTEYRILADGPFSPAALLPLLHDRMTEAVLHDEHSLFSEVAPRPLQRVSLAEGPAALERANVEMGLALSGDEIRYLFDAFAALQRDLTDVELVMFANVNSEHCRHKIFNAGWTINGARRERSLFAMIRNTHARCPQGTVKAYADNAGVIEGWRTPSFRPGSEGPFAYGYRDQLNHILCKVETHNHPTAISPFPGASTGVGGEIRDEGATGIGGQSQAGLCAFYTSHLRIPGFAQPWERDFAEFPERLATPLQIMTDGPLGGAAFGNEFGRPNILGLFRTFEETAADRYRGYHKPIMVAGGVGLIAAGQVEKKQPQPGDRVVQLGGPAMLIGLGGGYASSMDSGSNLADLDFASVQRDNPEMQRRCQELISRCISLGDGNPIVSIHDVGAGGLSNACPELVEGQGARFDLRAIPNDDPGMSPMEIWCNEAQERYVLVVRAADLERFERLARRERCLHAVIGEITGDGNLSVSDPLLGGDPVGEMPLEVILGKPPRMHRDVSRGAGRPDPLDLSGVTIAEAVARLLRFPAVADKTFLITIADRTVTGLVARDQMAGPWQTPISDVAVTAASFRDFRGSAMAMGERAPLALIDPPASGRMAIAEAVTNIAAARIGPIEKVKLSANWMCACGEEGEDAALYDTVEAVGMEFCPRLGVSIPVGKDSLSMRAAWRDSRGADRSIAAPLSLVVSAFAPVADIRATVTPDLKPEADSPLLLIDLGRGRNRLGGSCLAQVYSQVGDEAPDVEPEDVRRLFAAVQELIARGLLLAYHDRSDGGLFVAAAEMAFGARTGLELNIDGLGGDPLAALFSEEIGALLQIRGADLERVLGVLEAHGLGDCTHEVGRPGSSGAGLQANDRPIGFESGDIAPRDSDGPGGPHDGGNPPDSNRPGSRDSGETSPDSRDSGPDSGDADPSSSGSPDIGGTGPNSGGTGPDRNDRCDIVIRRNGDLLFRESASKLKAAWSELTFRMQALRDNPDCAAEERAFNADFSDPGPRYAVALDPASTAPDKSESNPPGTGLTAPRAAILREQGINGQVEMAAAFDAAGFEAVDVTMTDLIDGRADLSGFQALAACGGFSYGDVLGAGAGWARSILFNGPLRDMFAAFFERPGTVTLGVCNGCQMLAHLAALIPGSEGWPRFARNRSEQFEARQVTVEIEATRSVLLSGMEGSRLPIAVAHGEGRVEFPEGGFERLSANCQLGMRYVDNRGQAADSYPFNPNGSAEAVAAVTSADGRVTIMMPHPERVFRNAQLSYRPRDWDASAFSPWIELFRGAYRFVK